MDVQYRTGEVLDVRASGLGNLVVRTPFATIHHLEAAETPQPEPSPVAVLNVTGWCSWNEPCKAGLCVMLTGWGPTGQLLWACNLAAAYSPQVEGPQGMHQSLLIDREAVGLTRRIKMRLTGGRFG